MSTSVVPADVFRYVEHHAGTFIRQLEQMIEVPSVSGSDRLLEMGVLTAEQLRLAGLETELLDGGGPPIVLADSGPSRGPTVLFYDHYDVQSPEPAAAWDSPPFVPTHRNGSIFGRGANDNKGNLCGRIAAIRAWRESIGKLPCRIKFLIEGEEEIGSPHLSYALALHAERFKADACIWESGGVDSGGAPLLMMGMRGMLSVELVVQGPRFEVHSREAVRIGNPAWRLIRALATLKDGNEQCLVPGFYDSVRELSDADLAAVRAIPSDEHAFAASIGISHFVRGLTGEPLREWMYFQPTCNISGLLAGTTGTGRNAKTVVPAEARAKLDFRLVPDQDPAAILSAMRQYLDDNGFADVEMVPRDAGTRGYRAPVDHPFVDLVDLAATDAYGKRAVRIPMNLGSGPMSLVIGPTGLPVASCGSANPNSRSHGANENIRIDDFILGIKHVVSIIARMGSTDVSGWSANSTSRAESSATSRKLEGGIQVHGD